MKRGLFLIAGILLTFNIQAVQTGDCTAGTQYCEQNSLGTTNSTTTVNTNTCLLYTSPSPRDRG